MVALACLFSNRKGSCWPLRTCAVVFHLASWLLLGGENWCGTKIHSITDSHPEPPSPKCLSSNIYSDFLKSWILLAKASLALGIYHAYQELLLVVSCDCVKVCAIWKRNSCWKLDDTLRNLELTWEFAILAIFR